MVKVFAINMFHAKTCLKITHNYLNIKHDTIIFSIFFMPHLDGYYSFIIFLMVTVSLQTVSSGARTSGPKLSSGLC